MDAKARPNSLGLWARATSTIKLKGAAAACIAGMIGLLTGLSGFESAAGREMLGHMTHPRRTERAWRAHLYDPPDDYPLHSAQRV
jgi:hypothetical protein